MGAVLTCASTQQQSEWLSWRKFKWKKIASKNTNRALRDTNADKTTVLPSHLRITMLLL